MNIAKILAALVDLLRRVFRAKEQREAQDERDQIDQDSAQYSADKFGDGRVRPVNADEADNPERDRGNGG